MKKLFHLEVVAVWKINELWYQNSLIVDVWSFINFMTSLFHGREDVIQRKAKRSRIVVPAGLAGPGAAVSLVFLSLESPGFILSTCGPGGHWLWYWVENSWFQFILFKFTLHLRTCCYKHLNTVINFTVGNRLLIIKLFLYSCNKAITLYYSVKTLLSARSNLLQPLQIFWGCSSCKECKIKRKKL